MRHVVGFGAAFCLLLAVPALGASDRGTAEEAKAMLEKAILEVKADEEGAVSNST